jgi:DNA invertase Pin-like site-specific DNA recombinase
MVQEHILADLRQRNVTLISAMEPDLCSEDPGRVLMRHIMGAIAQYDRAMIVLKLRGARKRMKAATGRCEGRKRYGEKPGEAAILARIMEMRPYNTLEEIIDVLTREGIMTRTGKKWRVSTLSGILRRVTSSAVLNP